MSAVRGQFRGQRAYDAGSGGVLQAADQLVRESGCGDLNPGSPVPQTLLRLPLMSPPCPV